MAGKSPRWGCFQLETSIDFWDFPASHVWPNGGKEEEKTLAPPAKWALAEGNLCRCCFKITRVLKYGCVWKWCIPRTNGSFNCENQWLTSWFVQWLEVTVAIVHWLCYISKDSTEKDTEIHPQRHVVYSEARAVKSCPTLLLMGMTALT